MLKKERSEKSSNLQDDGHDEEENNFQRAIKHFPCFPS